MYRYSVDNAITYTSEDVVLFRESPFASWMERLTLENPDHGIPPDVHSKPPGNLMQRQDDVAETLRGEGKHVCLVEWDAPEAKRRSLTLDAMRQGVDFIVNGQLALGPLSGSANLLMRTSGYSELGDYLYIPCDTQAKTTLHSAFRLCFLADLLHSLQGQLPPQLLIIRSGDDLVPLQTEDHIYHYLAVKQRFMTAMREFRKHRMPDPAESSHFGRWSECANEVLKQRMLRQEQQPDSVSDDAATEQSVAVLQQAVGAPLQSGFSAYDLDEATRSGGYGRDTGAGPTSSDDRRALLSRPYLGAAPVGPTLAEQARMINSGSPAPVSGKPGIATAGGVTAVAGRPDKGRPEMGRPEMGRPGQDRRKPGRVQPEQAITPVDEPVSSREHPEHHRRATDESLQNLEFIGSSRHAPQIGGQQHTEIVQEEPLPLSTTAPSPSLRDPSAHRQTSLRSEPLSPPPAPSLGQFYGADAAFESNAKVTTDEPVEGRPAAESADYAELRSGVDRDQVDSIRPATPPTVLSTSKRAYEDVTDKNLNKPAASKFSDSLITSEDYDI